MSDEVAEHALGNEHSPLPWSLDIERSGDYVVRDAKTNSLIVDTNYYPVAPMQEDAAYIVKAANAYPDLVRVLKGIAFLSPSMPGEVAEAQIAAQSALEKIGEL